MPDQARPPLSIFYVEDDPADADLLKEALTMRGAPFSLTVLGDGQTALDFIRPTSLLPDVIVLNLNLRRVDGLSVLSALKADMRWRRIPVLVFVDPHAPNARRAEILGADLCCVKPMDWDAWPDLIAALRQLSTHEKVQCATR